MTRRTILAGVLILVASVVGAEQFARVGVVGGSFARTPVDARGEALGLAAVALPSGPTAFWWNAAPLPEDDLFEASYTVYDYPVEDLDWHPLALRATRGNLTVGAMWGHLHIDPMLVRTAYEPDGDGEVFEASSDLWQGSVAVDVVPWLAPRAVAWRWMLGANTHLIRQKLAETRLSTWDADLATTVAWSPLLETDQRLRLVLSGMLHDVRRGTWTYDEVRSRLPRYVHVGLAMELDLGADARRKPVSRMAMLVAWQRDPDHELADSEHLGVEVEFGGLVALRVGHRDGGAWEGEGWSWGGGVTTTVPWGAGIRLTLDYAHLERELTAFDEALDHWTVRVGTPLSR